VWPVLLKALMRHERFDTPRAMLMLGVAEPQVSETLRRLAEEGWVSWEGDREHVDHWRSMPLGHRLAASRLIRRFPIEQGRALLPKIVEAARNLNANPEASHRIGEIFLFGSILTGEDDGDAGDIDLVVHVHRRRLPDDRLNALIAAEEQKMPRHLDFYHRLNRQAEDLQRAIKKVSSKISLHGFSDVETYGAPHRQLYRYDVETEAEAPADHKIRVATSQARPDPETEHRLPPPRDQRAWPVAPNAPVILRPMDAAPLRLAQHLWMKGLGARQVARRLNLPEQAVAGYLASRAHARHDVPPRFDVSLDWMIDHACKPPSDHAVVITIANATRPTSQSIAKRSMRRPSISLPIFGYSAGRTDGYQAAVTCSPCLSLSRKRHRSGGRGCEASSSDSMSGSAL
jgi:predicted nucleotidyltransferase